MKTKKPFMCRMFGCRWRRTKIKGDWKNLVCLDCKGFVMKCERCERIKCGCGEEK